MEIYAILAQTLVIVVCTYGVYIILNTKPEKPVLRSVAILVLGDMGRSPRMMYHAESWAKSGFETYLIGYRGVLCVFPCAA
jgi:beta-1,4-mannosyltransferase